MSSGFEELSQEMTPEEKRDLLGRIHASLNLTAKDIDHIVSKGEGPDELKHRLTREVKQLGFFDRLLVRIVAFFTSRAEYEIMADRKLSSTREVLRERVPEFLVASRGEWSPDMGRLIYDVYADAQALRPIFDHLFQQKLTLESGLLQMIREEHPAAAHSLEDLVSDEEIATTYRKDQRRSSLQSLLEQRLSSSLEAVPAAVFERVKLRFRPLYFLRPLVQFPYPFLLDLFGHDAEKQEIAKYPPFVGVPWRKASGLLERFYYGVFLSTKFELAEGGLSLLYQGVVDRIGDEKTAWSVELIQQRMADFVRVVQDIARRLPWKEILQWSFQDPYYSVKYVLPQFSVRDFYESALAMNFRSQLEERIPSIRQQLLAEERATLFLNSPFQPLEFCVPGVGAAQKTRGFRHPDSLGLLWGFLSHHYMKKILPFYQSLCRMIPPANKSVLQGLSNAMDELTELYPRVQAFDRSLHPDSVEGKEFHRLKYELSSRAMSLKPFLDLVQNKDAQAEELLTGGLEGLQALQRQLEAVRERNVPALKSILRLPYLLEGRQESIENCLDRLLSAVQTTRFVLREAHHFES